MLPDCVGLVTSAGLELNDYDSVNLMGTGVTTVIIAYAKHAPVPRAGARLEALDRVLHVVAKRCKGECLTSKHVNKAVRNLRYIHQSGKSAAQVVDDVLSRLVEGGLAEDVEEGGRKVRKGRPVRRCRWKAWAAINGNPASNAFRLSLGLGEDDFD